MKKMIFPLLLLTTLMSCGDSGDKKDTESKVETTTKEETPPPANDLSSNPDYQKGLKLVTTSNCLTCHKVDEPFTGPTYRDIANKYAGMPDTIVAHLAGKVIKGGSGVWGQVLMTPHPELSQADAEAMVKYILLLKK